MRLFAKFLVNIRDSMRELISAKPNRITGFLTDETEKARVNHDLVTLKISRKRESRTMINRTVSQKRVILFFFLSGQFSRNT